MRWEGLEELKRTLRELPDTLAHEAEPIVRGAADEAYREAYAAYPDKSGTLRKGLTIRPAPPTRFGASVRLLNTVWYAGFFEIGTAARYTSKRFRASRGSMPPGRVFVPAAARARARMWRNLARLLERHGFTVRGA